MPKVSFLITVCADSVCGNDDSLWPAESSRMATLLTSVLMDKTKLSILTKGAKLSACDSEVEVSFEEGQVCGRAVVTLEGEGRIVIDKGALGKQLKGNEHAFEVMKIEKQAVNLN